MNLHMCVSLRTKFQVSSIILTSFRQGIILPSTQTSQSKHLKSPTDKGQIMYQRYYIDLFSIVYLYIVYFVPAISKRDKIFKSYFCVTIIFDCGCGCLISYYYSFFSSFSSFIGVICSVQVIIYFNLFFSPKSKWLIWCIVKQA